MHCARAHTAAAVYSVFTVCFFHHGNTKYSYFLLPRYRALQALAGIATTTLANIDAVEAASKEHPLAGPSLVTA